jgi:hypothetical protein
MMKRRTFFTTSLLLSPVLWSLVASAQEGDEVVVRIRVDDSVQDSIPSIIQKQLTITPDTSAEASDLARRVPSSRAVPVIVVIVGALTIPILSQMVKELLRQTYYGGVIIDTRSLPPSITSDPKIPGNMVVIIDHDGKASQLANDQLSPDILRRILVKK